MGTVSGGGEATLVVLDEVDDGGGVVNWGSVPVTGVDEVVVPMVVVVEKAVVGPAVVVVGAAVVVVVSTVVVGASVVLATVVGASVVLATVVVVWGTVVVVDEFPPLVVTRNEVESDPNPPGMTPFDG